MLANVTRVISCNCLTALPRLPGVVGVDWVPRGEGVGKREYALIDSEANPLFGRRPISL